MTQYKSIREWIAEGVDPIGYVDRFRGAVLVSITMDAVASRCILEDDSSEKPERIEVSLNEAVAPPAPKRLSDEELLRQYSQACVGRTLDTASDLRSQILDRMKGRGDEQLLEDVEGAMYKGPTRGEVERRLSDYLPLYERWANGAVSTEKFCRSQAEFLSIFPEADQ